MPTLLRCIALACSLALTLESPAGATAYDAHPKIVVILVIDQFRADYLERYEADFKGRGFRLLLDHGSYFPDCYYGYANTKTAPGHATIGTGAYTDGHGIGSNEWWDLGRNRERPVSSVEDERYALVGSPAAAETQPTDKTARPTPGSSPRNLLASTVGDELRLATGGAAEVWGVSLKDRAAILPAGAAANGAFWIDQASGRFITSTYYMPQLPAWAAAFNDGSAIADAEAAAGVQAPVKSFYAQVGRTPAANAYEFAFAEALITGEQLGKHPVTDLITISLSANDILGHQVGPDSPEEHAMVDQLDTDLDGFFTWLDRNVDGGLGNVWVALTADHGVAPTPAVSSALG
jgi:predicted AlkP superfamily pyrophosphatase or phosphodiesterase